MWLFSIAGSVREAHVTIAEHMQIYIQNMQADTFRKQGKAQGTVVMCLTLKKLLLRSMRQDCIIISLDMVGCMQLFCVRLGLCGSQTHTLFEAQKEEISTHSTQIGQKNEHTRLREGACHTVHPP